MVALWLATVYLIKTREHKITSLITAIPATYMTAVSMTYILMANEGFGIEKEIAYPIGITFALLHFVGYMFLEHKRQKQASEMIPISTDKVSGKAKDKAK
jgi:carbon starvation protein CstA